MSKSKKNNKDRVEKQRPPMLMGDILEGAFGGTVKTGVPTLQDLVAQNEGGDDAMTPAMSFEEFDELSKDPALFLAFYEAAKERACAESIMFILEVLNYVTLPDLIRLEKQKDLLLTYIVDGAEYQVNLTETASKEIKENAPKGLPNAFDSAQKHITHMLFRNIPKSSYVDRPIARKKIKGEKQLRQAIEAVVSPRVTDPAFELLTGKMRFNFLRIRYTMKPKTAEEEENGEHKPDAKDKQELGVLQVTVLGVKDVKGLTDNDQLYFNIRSVVNQVPDKHTKQRSSIKKGPNPTWNEQFIFDVVKEVEAQVIEFHFWGKQFLPNSSIAKVTLVVKDILPNLAKEKYIEELALDMGDGGQLLVKVHFLPQL